MTAALGDILDINSNSQKFFGGGQVNNTAKNVANDESCHTDDILCLTISSNRKLAATGQVGSSPVAFLWDATNGQMKSRFKLARGGRGVNAIAISQDGSVVGLTDNSNDHNVYFFDANSGNELWKEKGGTNKVFDMCFNMKSGDEAICCSAGVKHIQFWSPNTKNYEKGLFGDGAMTSFSCCVFDQDGLCYTGGANSKIYVWEGRNYKTSVAAHKGGFICALKWADGKLYSGGKDGNVVITNCATLEVEKSFNFGCLIRAIDVDHQKALVGLRDGTIFHLDIESQNKNTIMESHSDGEVWGLASSDDTHILTTADDNKIKLWNLSSRKCEATGVISTEKRKAARGGASSLSPFPDSQCARSVAHNPSTGHIALGHNDGTVTVRSGQNTLDDTIKTI